MGKRNHVVVLSSDDEDEKPSNRSYSKPKSRFPVTRTNPRAAKKARVSDSRYQSCKRSCTADGAGLFWENVDEEFTGLKVSAGTRRTDDAKELWVDKYKPCSLEDLAVHKKKVEEVKVWFEERLRTPKERASKNVIVITGQAGVGKSATIHIIASLFGAQLCEWNTPTPTIWQEHVHNSNSGIRYTSKLDDFENFVEKVRKYGLIQSFFFGESRSPLLLIDDLPLTNAKVAYGRLRNCLNLLVESVRIPTVILVTDYGKSDPADSTMQSSDELVLFLESAGACKVAFNPITTNAIKKVMSRICRQERCNVSNEQIDLIAKASGGDIRNAITSLQFFCLKPDPTSAISSSDPSSICTRGKNQFDPLDDQVFSPIGKDETLSLFHALGKFLHNKREPENAIGFGQVVLTIREKYTRLPMKMDAPEKVLSQAHGQARPIAEFLHENVMDFLSEEAIDDACAVVSYLGDADLLLASSHGMLGRYNEAENILQLAAGSVAVRGVLFGNSQPVSSRWHAIRRPKLWQVEQSFLHKKHDMARQRHVTSDRLSSSDVSVIATEYTPLRRWLGYGASGDFEACSMEDEDLDMSSLSVKESETSDDEIEDWED